MDDMNDSLMNLNSEHRGRVALRQLTHVPFFNLGMNQDEVTALFHANYNSLKNWINFYGPFVPTMSVEDPTPIEPWQIYAEQIRTIIAPVNEKGTERNIHQRVMELQWFLIKNEEGFTNSVNGKPLKENGPE